MIRVRLPGMHVDSDGRQTASQTASQMTSQMTS